MSLGTHRWSTASEGTGHEPTLAVTLAVGVWGWLGLGPRQEVSPSVKREAAEPQAAFQSPPNLSCAPGLDGPVSQLHLSGL